MTFFVTYPSAKRGGVSFCFGEFALMLAIDIVHYR